MAQKDQVVRLLIVEDSMEIAEQLISTLRNGGIPVRPVRAETAAELASQIEEHLPDVILVDAANKSPTLIETVAAVRKSSKDIPVVALVAEVNEKCVIDASMAGARACALLSRGEHLQMIVRREFTDVMTRRAVRRLETSLREVEKRCDALLDSSRDPIAFVHEGMHVRANKAYLEMFGYEEFEEIEGTPILDMIGGAHGESFKALLRKMSKGEKPPERLEIKARRMDGAEFDAVMQFEEATFEGEPCTQITFRRQEIGAEQAAELDRLRSQDLVTGLYNRSSFISELDKIAAEAAAGKSDLTLFFVEPDNFRKVLDTVGIGNADLLLADMAKLLKSQLREHDIAARVGEFNFGVIVPRLSHEKAELIAQNLRKAFEEHVFELNGKSVNLTISNGVVFIGEKIANTQNMLSEAAAVLKTAQTEGGNRFAIFDPAAQDKADAEKQRAWLNLVKDALAHDGFTLYFQPIISLMGEEGEFYEILLRLNSPKGEISPGHFLPIAEKNGLMPAIDRWVIGKAIRTVAEREREGRKCTFFIKTTPQTMDDAAILPWIATQLQAARLRGDALVFEAPEGKVVTNLKAARTFQKGLEQFHSSFAIEQFGSGLNSMQLLKHVDAKYLKIDRTYMAELPKNKENQAKVKELADQARSMDKLTVAEFVEDAASMSILFSCGVNFVQGNFLQEPEKVMSYDFG
ncbi:MAG: EAL domain-containing protein [Xanthomonadales bacterium]|nr:EAL domain-containing protein [Xanthomonadales bacterium]